MTRDFLPPPMTPAQFKARLADLVARLKREAEWKELSFFAKHHLQLLEDDFERMITHLLETRTDDRQAPRASEAPTDSRR